MMLDQQQEKSLKSAVLVSRLIVSALCFAAPMFYAFVYAVAVLKGNPKGFLAGFAEVPFAEPVVIVLLCMAAATGIGVFTASWFLFARAAPKASRVAAAPVFHALMAASLLETIAIYGLVLGFMFGPQMASLTLAMQLVTVLGGVLVFPRETPWHAVFERSFQARYH